MILVPPLLPGLDLVTVVTKCSGGGGLQPPDRAVSSPESSGSGLITLMVGMAAVSASSSSPLSTLLMERSRLPEAALVAGVLAAVAQNGGKLKERGVRSGVFGSDPPPPPADEVSKLKSALNTCEYFKTGVLKYFYFPYLDTERLRSFSESAALLSIKVLNLSSSAWQSGDTNT